MRPIIAFTGKMFSGKTEAAKIAATYLNYSFTGETRAKITKFAQPLYDIQDFIYNRIGKEAKVKDRKLLQFLGTEWGRNFEPDLWVNLWEMSVKTDRMFTPGNLITIVDDLRFNNEAAKIQSMGGVIIEVVSEPEVRATRGNIIDPSHKSEQGIGQEFITATIYNNKSLEDLAHNVKYLLEIL